MNDNPEAPSGRARERAAAKARRAAKAALRQQSFEALAAGWSPEQIAELRKVSPRTIRREIDRALDQRRLDAPDRYAHLQVARLMKALRVADASIDRGLLTAVGPLVKVVTALDRYHGLKDRSRFSPRAPLGAPLPPPAPPLKLTHSASPPGREEAESQNAQSGNVTTFGA